MRTISILAMILFSLSFRAQPATNRTEAEARTLSDSIYGLLVKGEDFTKLVRQFSDDPGTKKEGGVMRGLTKGVTVPEFEDAVMKLQINEISRPFRTQYGFHIAQMLENKGDVFTVRHILVMCR